MFALLLTLSILGITVQKVAGKAYNNKVSRGAFTFSAMSVLFSLLVFILNSGGKFNFSPDFIPYSIGFAVFYSAATVGTFLSIATGPLSITGLVSKYSLLIPTLYGILYLNEPTGYSLYVGLALLAVSLLLINFEGKAFDKKLTLKWGVFMFISFIGNGGCSTVQKIQQIRYGGQGKNEFMIVALALSFIFISVAALLFERENLLKKIVVCPHWIIICGISNGLVNLFVMFLAAWPASVVFPIISAGGVILTYLLGIVLYKEKLSLWQTLGMLLGIVSIIFFNI